VPSVRIYAIIISLDVVTDACKFGQQMLEKMGWKPGLGLGAKEQGITEQIKVAYKNDKTCKCVS
jgi:peptide deformylase